MSRHLPRRWRSTHDCSVRDRRCVVYVDREDVGRIASLRKSSLNQAERVLFGTGGAEVGKRILQGDLETKRTHREFL